MRDPISEAMLVLQHVELDQLSTEELERLVVDASQNSYITDDGNGAPIWWQVCDSDRQPADSDRAAVLAAIAYMIG